jgi:hypothetical protein
VPNPFSEITRSTQLGLAASTAFHEHLRQRRRQRNLDVPYHNLISRFINRATNTHHHQIIAYYNLVARQFRHLETTPDDEKWYYDHPYKCENTKLPQESEKLRCLPWCNSAINRKIDHSGALQIISGVMWSARALLPEVGAQRPFSEAS